MWNKYVKFLNIEDGNSKEEKTWTQIDENLFL